VRKLTSQERRISYDGRFFEYPVPSYIAKWRTIMSLEPFELQYAFPNPTEFDLSVPPGSEHSAIDYIGDVDTYRVYLPGGPDRSYDFDVYGGTDAYGGTFDSRVALYDGNGTREAYGDSGGLGYNSHIHYTALSGGNYTLVVAGVGDETGDYTVFASPDYGIA
jgi:hypothetical protein